MNGIKLENDNTSVENYSLETSDGYCNHHDIAKLIVVPQMTTDMLFVAITTQSFLHS
jgi:hypothetical protein